MGREERTMKLLLLALLCLCVESRRGGYRSSSKPIRRFFLSSNRAGNDELESENLDDIATQGRATELVDLGEGSTTPSTRSALQETTTSSDPDEASVRDILKTKNYYATRHLGIFQSKVRKKETGDELYDHCIKQLAKVKSQGIYTTGHLADLASTECGDDTGNGLCKVSQHFHQQLQKSCPGNAVRHVVFL